MEAIRIQKIDGQEFVTYKDYLREKEENKDLNKQIEQFKKGVKVGTNIIERLEEENKKLKSELEKELVYNTVYLPVRFFKKEAYIRIDHYKEIMDKRENAVNKLEEENKKLKYVIDSVMEKAGIEYIRLADGDVFMNPKNKLHISDTIQIDKLFNSKQ